MAYKRHDVKLGVAPGTDPTHADMCYIQSFYSDRAGLAILDCPPAASGYHWYPEGGVAEAEAQVTVRTSTATVWAGYDGPNGPLLWRQVRWSEGGYLYAVSGADATGSPERAATLVTVANGLR